MTYPQAAASKFVTEGQSVYRINTELDSAGDIYEIDAGCNGFALGPLSDISRARVSYYDPQGNPTSQVSDVILSPDRNYVARVDARLDQVYSGTNLKGRIFVSVDEVFDRAYNPTGSGVGDVIVWVPPRLDVIAYFDSLPSVIPPRSDGYFELETSSVQGAGNSLYLIYPYFGRKYGQVSLTNLSSDDFDFELRGVKFFKTGAGTPPATYGEETVLLASATVLVGDQTSQVIRASSVGTFDALILRYDFTAGAGPTRGPFPTRIITSDDAL